MDGFINLLKPTGMSSAQAVGFVKRALQVKKIGHAGTLDPLASGVLPIMLGRATKLFEAMQHRQKEYICELHFGFETDTLDADGGVIHSSAYIPSNAEIDSVLPLFWGDIKQIPPSYSALKHQGSRMYELARKGISFDIPQRDTTVFGIKRLNDIKDGRVRIAVKCKSGFYVRSLCRDIGLSLGSRAYMSMLIRRSVGDFCLSDARSIEELQAYIDNKDKSFILPLDHALRHIPACNVEESQLRRLCNGVSLPYTLPDGSYRIYGSETFIGLAKAEKQMLRMETLLKLWR